MKSNHIEYPELAKTSTVPQAKPRRTAPSKMSWHIDVPGINRCPQDLGGLSKKMRCPQAGTMFTNMPAIAPELVMGADLALKHQEWGAGYRAGVVTS